MNEVEEIASTPVTEVLFGGPSQIILVVLLTCLGVYHLAFSARSLFSRAAPVAVGHHAMLLFATPAILFLYICAAAPTSPLAIGSFYLSAYSDTAEAAQAALLRASCFGWLGLAVFLPNLLLAIVALHRGRLQSQ